MSINYDTITPQVTRVIVTYPDGLRPPRAGLVTARHGAHVPTYEVRLDCGIKAWYPGKWLTREDDPDRVPAVTR